MTSFVRRLRGVLGTALVWGAGWLLVGLGFGTYRTETFPPVCAALGAGFGAGMLALARRSTKQAA